MGATIRYGIAVESDEPELSQSVQRHISYKEYRVRNREEAVRCVEHNCYAHGPDYGDDGWFEAICALAEQPGAVIVNIHARPDDEYTLCGQGSGSGCGRRLVNTQRAEQRCDHCGAALLRSQIPPELASRSLNSIALELQYATTELGKNGKRLVLENTYEPPQVMRKLLDQLPGVGFTLDVGHALLYHPNLLDYVYLLRDRLCHLHLHDNMGGDSESYHDKHLPPGFGRADWGALAKALSQIEYRGTATFECMPPDGWVEYFERSMSL